MQYGLAALNAGKITKAQFLDLNEKIGGLDIDANFSPPADGPRAHDHACGARERQGRRTAAAVWPPVPILDFDVIYTDRSPAGDVHMKYYHFSTRERLIKENGHARNMVMWSGVFGPRAPGIAPRRLPFDDRVARTTSPPTPRTLHATSPKVVRNKPEDLTDGCWTGDAPPFGLSSPQRQFLGGPGTSASTTSIRVTAFRSYEAGIAARERHHQVPAAADRPGRLLGDLRAGGDRAPAADLPRTASRLVPARRRAAGRLATRGS